MGYTQLLTLNYGPFNYPFPVLMLKMGQCIPRITDEPWMSAVSPSVCSSATVAGAGIRLWTGNLRQYSISFH